MKKLGYNSFYQVLNAKDYGIPQNRERVFVVSIKVDLDNHPFLFPLKQELKLKLKDMLEDEVDEKYYLSEKAIHGRMITHYQKYKLEENCINNKEIHPTILARFEGAPTLYKETIQITNATKKGYLEACEGDGIDISSRMQYHRGNVQKESIQTITTSGGNDRGVVVNE
jgi:DNA (cytosine-5)-methyltransferase 1